MSKFSLGRPGTAQSGESLSPKHGSPSATTPADTFEQIIESLNEVYEAKIKPIEKEYNFEQFFGLPLTHADIKSKPMVLLIGQYSVGKTSFIKYLIENDYPGCHIGPEPTTDRFIAVMGGEEKIIPGNAAAVSQDLPFTALQTFGSSFLSKFQVSQAVSPLLESLTLIDTPGILSGEKQRINRQYDFTSIIEWFASRVDMILLLFDAHKLDISDEFKLAIQALKGQDDKIRVVLNKADMVSGQQLLRVYGALMWSLGKVLSNPEAPRIYLGSFWDEPLKCTDCESLLKVEQRDLIKDLRQLPKNAAMRKINEIIKRTRMAKVHALIVAHLKQNMPTFFGKEKTQSSLLENLAGEFKKLQQLHQIPAGDFPNPERYRERLQNLKIDKMAKLDKKMMAALDEALTVDLPALIQRLPHGQPAVSQVEKNPFATELTAPPPQKLFSFELMDKQVYMKRFQEAKPFDGKLSGAAVKPYMEEYGINMADLAQIWTISDWTQGKFLDLLMKDGYLDMDEFIAAMWLCEIMKRGWISQVPETMPLGLIPHHRRL